MSNMKKTTVIVCVLLALACTLMFLVIRPVTGIFLVSYIFAIIGIAGLCFSTLYLADNKDRYPWGTALINTFRVYLIIEVIISAAFILVEQRAKWSTGAQGIASFVQSLHYAPGWYFLIHAVLLIAFLIRFIILKAGLQNISDKDKKIKVQTSFIRFLTSDAEGVVAKAKSPEAKEVAEKIYEAIRYSDPMSDDMLASSEQNISLAFKKFSEAVEGDSVEQIKKDGESLLLAIEDRNRKCKALK